MAPDAVYGDTAFGTGRRGEQYGTGYGYASLGGASVAENIYSINGMNETNFRNGLSASTVPFEFYDQLQLKTGGFGAEFGRATGGVINSVTKRGTNDWQFTVGGYYEPDSLGDDVPNVKHPSSWRRYDSVGGFDQKDEFDLFVSVGGSLVRDRLLVYGIYDFRSVDERTYSAWGRLNKDVDDDGFWGLKLDWLLTDNHRIEYTGFSDDRTVERTSFEWDESTLGRLAVRRPVAGQCRLPVLERPTAQRLRVPPDRSLRAPVRPVIVFSTGHAGTTRFVGNNLRHLPARPGHQVHPRGVRGWRVDRSTRRLQRVRLRQRDRGRRTGRLVLRRASLPDVRVPDSVPAAAVGADWAAIWFLRAPGFAGRSCGQTVEAAGRIGPGSIPPVPGWPAVAGDASTSLQKMRQNTLQVLRGAGTPSEAVRPWSEVPCYYAPGDPPRRRDASTCIAPFCAGFRVPR